MNKVILNAILLSTSAILIGWIYAVSLILGESFVDSILVSVAALMDVFALLILIVATLSIRRVRSAGSILLDLGRSPKKALVKITWPFYAPVLLVFLWFPNDPVLQSPFGNTVVVGLFLLLGISFVFLVFSRLQIREGGFVYFLL